MEKLAKRIRNSNQKYFDAGVDAGTQKACDLLLVAAYECGFIRTPEKAKKLMETLFQFAPPAWGVTSSLADIEMDNLFQFALQQRRRYRHFSKANNGINVQCWNAQFFHISDSDADVLVPAKEIAVRGENIEGIEQFFHSEASSMMPAASCRSRSR